MSEEVFYCDEGCGVRVDREGGTCLACWEVIDAAKEAYKLGQQVSESELSNYTNGAK